MKKTPQFGWCAPLDQAATLAAIGYDYIEFPLAPFGLEDAAALADAKAAISASPLATSASCVFLARDLRVVGPDADIPRYRNYIGYAVELLVHAKADVIVYGSGWARNIPDGYDRARGEAEFVASLDLAAEALKGSGTTLVIEPLNTRESNVANSVSEGTRFARAVNRPEVRVLADFYHMDEEKEPLGTLEDNAHWLRHIHVADTGRLNPGTGQYPYPEFVRCLRNAGYAHRISVECGSPIDDDGKRLSLAYLKGIFA